MFKIKYSLAILLFLTGFNQVSFAQPDDEYNDLLFLYVDGKYEKCIDKAMNYIEDDDTRRDPMPYIYVSQAYYEMSKLQEYDEDYPRAFRDAIKFAVKYRKKDKTGDYLEENSEYIDNLKIQTFEMADNYYQTGKYTKAKTYFKYLTGMDPTDWGSWLLRGVTETRLNMRSEAELSLSKGIEGVRNIDEGTFDEYLEGEKMLLKTGIIYYADYMKEIGKVPEALDLVKEGNTYFDGDNEYKIMYDEMIRG